MASSQTTREEEKTLDATAVAALGARLFDAELARTTVDPLTDAHPEMTVADAYAVQLEYARLRQRDGARLVGHKIGATSKAIQELFDIDTPDYGHLFDDMQCEEGVPIRIRELIQPLVEPEIAFVLNEELIGPRLTPGDVLDATRAVVPCLEVIDSRIHAWKIRLADTVSDNGSSARFVLGSTERPVDFDLTKEKVVIERNGEVVGRGDGAAVLGNPATSVAWLANALAAFGSSLPAGSVALSGSMTSAIEAGPGDEFVAHFDHLGTIAAEMADEERGSNE